MSEQPACSDMLGSYRVLSLGALGPEPWGLEGIGGHPRKVVNAQKGYV